ncbi:MAG: triose-phosphate isomerase [Candidatus Eisenbacteria bacterium]
MRRLLIAANWKMNLTGRTAADLAVSVRAYVEAAKPSSEVLVAPPYPYLPAVREALAGSAVLLAGQDVSAHEPGAFTGEVSAEMLADSGCTHAIVGHSERREFGGDSDETVRAKARRAADLGLGVILCVGEKEGERERGEQKTIVKRQLARALAGWSPREAEEKLVVAYEPVWAIGTGKTATPADAEDMHAFARKILRDRFGPETGERIRVLYGGSVKPANAGDLLGQENIDGALVGGASLDGDSFTAIISAGEKADRKD